MLPALLLLPFALAACATAPADRPAATAESTLTAARTAKLTAPDGRAVDVVVMAPAKPRGVILFSHGGGSNPGATAELTERLVDQEFAVLSPVHTDSQSLPADRRTDLRGALATRVADMKVTAEYAAQTFPGLPAGEVGFSYGALTALIGGGALSNMIPGAIGSVKAVVMSLPPVRSAS